ncbi:hypothetical protein AKJ41_05595 [candidate division MSBL1 archaeon SCGC-AAA259O05]|uniref:Uncharacterized protein n=1 Tax=candidate division MSBL1 archaeon SCGC-AAA259O05 TaxID=1698271 RepID=A0A133UYU2_9EURY|nr:hypothetical protein AKJ41_05595 [candidate division MSBL1 archaeon SCGC-AAA259O05]
MSSFTVFGKTEVVEERASSWESINQKLLLQEGGSLTRKTQPKEGYPYKFTGRMGEVRNNKFGENQSRMR